MKYYRVTGVVGYTKSCQCPKCDGHRVDVKINETIARNDNTTTGADVSALIMAGVPKDADWEYGPHYEDVTLATVERQALADWNAQRPTASPLALAQARGKL